MCTRYSYLHPANKNATIIFMCNDDKNSSGFTVDTDYCENDTHSNNIPTDLPVIVSLWSARIPFIGVIADHHWFVINRDGIENRWEVWQKPDACSNSWGHLNLNLLPPNSGVGNGDAVHLKQWDGDRAKSFATRIEQSPQQYPWCYKYRYWPGPNSNTYVQWVLMEEHILGRRAPGKQYCRLFA